MADLSTWYNKGIYLMSTGGLDFDTYPSLRMHLCTKAYTPSAHAHDDVADITVTTAAGGTAYTSKALPTGSITVTESSDGATYFNYVDSIVWSSLGGNTDQSIRYAVVFMNNSSNDAGRSIVSVQDFGSGTIKSTNGSDFKVTIHASGIGKIDTVAV